MELIKKVIASIEHHWNGITRWFESRINNRNLEWINSLTQAAKRKAREYRTVENFIAMLYLLANKIYLKTILSQLSKLKYRGTFFSLSNVTMTL